MNQELLEALNALATERGIDRQILIQALETALKSAYRKHYGTASNVVVRIDPETGDFRVANQFTVADPVEDPETEISLEEAREIDPAYQLGDVVERPVEPRDFGRIAAQTARQVVMQQLREAERNLIYEEFASREGDLLTVVVRRVQGRNVYIDLGRTEAVLLPSEQIPGEIYRPGDRIRVYLAEVRQTAKGPQVVLSRAHPGLLKRLLELEVPEIHDGVVEIRAVAREAGARAKVAVASRDPNVDPVGACVGHRGMRIQNVVNELHGEKIDVIRWSDDPAEFVAAALSPARVSQVRIHEEERSARVVVPDYQLSLAIGRSGQNARLAAKLTGYRIDIRSESQLADEAMKAAVQSGAEELRTFVSEADMLPFERAFRQALKERREREERRRRLQEAGELSGDELDFDDVDLPPFPEAPEPERPERSGEEEEDDL
ncbi:MAG: transcription termination/antitermination protein NusA [Clostridia bacterium]|nr:transcription termination/antitermination protein NusA [Clostridia bacterium]